MEGDIDPPLHLPRAGVIGKCFCARHLVVYLVLMRYSLLARYFMNVRHYQLLINPWLRIKGHLIDLSDLLYSCRGIGLCSSLKFSVSVSRLSGTDAFFVLFCLSAEYITCRRHSKLVSCEESPLHLVCFTFAVILNKRSVHKCHMSVCGHEYKFDLGK